MRVLQAINQQKRDRQRPIRASFGLNETNVSPYWKVKRRHISMTNQGKIFGKVEEKYKKKYLYNQRGSIMTSRPKIGQIKWKKGIKCKRSDLWAPKGATQSLLIIKIFLGKKTEEIKEFQVKIGNLHNFRVIVGNFSQMKSENLDIWKGEVRLGRPRTLWNFS